MSKIYIISYPVNLEMIKTLEQRFGSDNIVSLKEWSESDIVRLLSDDDEPGKVVLVQFDYDWERWLSNPNISKAIDTAISSDSSSVIVILWDETPLLDKLKLPRLLEDLTNSQYIRVHRDQLKPDVSRLIREIRSISKSLDQSATTQGTGLRSWVQEILSTLAITPVIVIFIVIIATISSIILGIAVTEFGTVDTPTPTYTSTPTNTLTYTPTATSTHTPTSTNTPTVSSTRTPTMSSTTTDVLCQVIAFDTSDIAIFDTATVDANITLRLESGFMMDVIDIVFDEDEPVWYQVTFNRLGKHHEGYVQAEVVQIHDGGSCQRRHDTSD